MKLTHVRFFALLLSLSFFTSCAKPELRQEMVTESKAIELAKAEFVTTGRKVDDYNVTWRTDSSGRKWIVCFDKKGPYAVPGGKHLVTVEKITGKVVFMLGQ